MVATGRMRLIGIWRAVEIEPYRNLLSKNTGAKCRRFAVGVLTFAIAENSETTKVLQQFVVIQQVGGILRMADSLLIDQVGFKNDVTLGLESSFGSEETTSAADN